MKAVRIPDGTALYKYFLSLIPKRRAFQIVLGGKDDAGLKTTVRAELAKFCRAYAPCRNEREEGRREVWLHIVKLSGIVPDEELTVLLSTFTAEQRYQLFNPSSETFIE